MSGIQQGVLITLIGMSLVFAVIIFLWGVMALLVRVTTNNKTKTVEDVEDLAYAPETQVVELHRQAVAAAIVVAMAISADHKHRLKGAGHQRGDSLSPWQSAHRARQIGPKNMRG